MKNRYKAKVSYLVDGNYKTITKSFPSIDETKKWLRETKRNLYVVSNDVIGSYEDLVTGEIDESVKGSKMKKVLLTENEYNKVKRILNEDALDYHNFAEDFFRKFYYYANNHYMIDLKSKVVENDYDEIEKYTTIEVKVYNKNDKEKAAWVCWNYEESSYLRSEKVTILSPEYPHKVIAEKKFACKDLKEATEWTIKELDEYLNVATEDNLEDNANSWETMRRYFNRP